MSLRRLTLKEQESLFRLYEDATVLHARKGRPPGDRESWKESLRDAGYLATWDRLGIVTNDDDPQCPYMEIRIDRLRHDRNRVGR